MTNLVGATFEKLSGQRFALGQTVMTPGTLALPIRDILRALGRHCRGDWGDLSEGDKAENEFAVDKPLRILSAYSSVRINRKRRRMDHVKFWIITEADRSVTTVLLPEEY